MIGSSGTAQGAGPSQLAVASARTYNRAHRHYVEVFDTATDRRCMGADGQLDPVAVWHWQSEHGIRPDGRVGPQTSAKAIDVGAGTGARSVRRSRRGAGTEPTDDRAGHV
jgi:hypothetical protein